MKAAINIIENRIDKIRKLIATESENVRECESAIQGSTASIQGFELEIAELERAKDRLRPRYWMKISNQETNQ